MEQRDSGRGQGLPSDAVACSDAHQTRQLRCLLPERHPHLVRAGIADTLQLVAEALAAGREIAVENGWNAILDQVESIYLRSISELRSRRSN